MDMLIIEGGCPLAGSVVISGSKNSALPIVVATLLTKKPSLLKNVPNLADTRFLFDLLRSFGADVAFSQDCAAIDSSAISKNFAHYDVVRKMRASVLVLAPLLSRFGEAAVSLPGGCAIGTRPIDIHLEGLKRLGATIKVKDGYVYASLKRGAFIGNEYELPLPSVGASENLIMAACLAKGASSLRRVAREPEVVELCCALNDAGASIKGVGTSVLKIDGVTSLNGIKHKIKPDRIEAGTFIALAAATNSQLTLKEIYLPDMMNVIEPFEQTGVKFKKIDLQNGFFDILITPPRKLSAIDVETAAFPGFPTDMQAQLMASMTVASGTSTIYERIFENRMMHVLELRRMGANIELKNGVAKVHGQNELSAAPVMATDLRASASLVIAGLIANGKSEIRRVYHLDRGYEALEEKLKGLGAKIERKKQVGG